MTSNVLTDEERRVIHRILTREPNKKESIFSYGVYILPSLIFAAYGLWKHDYIAILAAYLALFIVAVMYLSYVHDSGRVLYSAVKKYEERLGLLAAKNSQDL